MTIDKDEKHKEYCRKYYSDNRERELERKRIYRISNRERIRIAQPSLGLKSVYGISESEYNNMLCIQNGKCAICDRPETVTLKGKIRRLSVDHCHKKGNVRGLLCAKCNVALGLFGDNLEIMISAINYLQKKDGV